MARLCRLLNIQKPLFLLTCSSEGSMFEPPYLTTSLYAYKSAGWMANSSVSILYKSIAGRYWPVRVADGPITARYRFIKNASWECLAGWKTVPTLIKLLPCLLSPELKAPCKIVKDNTFFLIYIPYSTLLPHMCSYKCTVKQFSNLKDYNQCTFIYFFIKSYVVGTHLNWVGNSNEYQQHMRL